jgi:hypothetical protein
MGGGAYEKGRLDRCRQQPLTLSFGMRISSSSHLEEGMLSKLRITLTLLALLSMVPPRSRSPPVGQDSHAPGAPGSSGRLRAQPVPSDAFPGCANDPAQGVHAEVWARRQPLAEQAAPHGGPDQADRLAACSVSYAPTTRICAKITSFAQKMSD